MTLRLADVLAAERALDAAQADRRALDDPGKWTGLLATDKDHHRTLHLEEANFRRAELADAAVERAYQRVLAVRRAWAGCSCDPAGPPLTDHARFASATLPTGGAAS